MKIISKKPKITKASKPVEELSYTHKPVMEIVPIEPALPPLKVVLVNTENKASTLIKKLQHYQGNIGFDTEVVGPNLRGQDFVNISHSSLLGFSLAFEDEKCYYIPVRHKGNNIDFSNMKSILLNVQDAAHEHRVWAHNAKFDQQVMIREGSPLHGLLDSMVAAWLVTGKNFGLGLKQLAEEVLNRKSPKYDPALHSKTGDEAKLYCGHDALNTLQLGLHYRKQLVKCWSWFQEECEFAHTLAEMKLLGMRIDHAKLRALSRQAQENLKQIKLGWDNLAGPGVSITSSKQLQSLFEDGTWTPHGMTAGRQFGTGKLAMEWNVINAQTDAGRKLAQLRLDYQEVAKIVTTYTNGLIEESLQWADHKLHSDLFHFGTVTGRLASANPNLQNQPAHGEWAAKVREAFIPDPGCEFTSADYSQIELRYFAEYCGGKILRAYQEGIDIHQQTADAMGIERQQGKMVNFGFLLYGGGPDKLAAELGVSKQAAEEKIAALHAAYPEVEEWRQSVIGEVGGTVEWQYGKPEIVGGRGENPWAQTMVGRRRHFPELNPDYLKRSDPEEYNRLAKHYREKCRARGKQPTAVGLWMSIRSRGERLVVNYLIQGGTRDLLVMGMNHYRRNAPDPTFQIVMTVHDEVLTQHPVGVGQVGRDFLQYSLEHVGARMGLEVPIVAEPKTGSTWGEVK